MLWLSANPVKLGLAIGGLLELIFFVLKSNESPAERQCTFAFLIWKYEDFSLETPVTSATKTPFLPQTVPTPFLQQRQAYSSMPTPMVWLSWVKAGISLPKRPLRSKCVSTWKSMKPNPGIKAPFSLYWRQSVPFLKSESPWLKEIGRGANPALLVKQSMPKDEPPPQVYFDWTAVPAETPTKMTSLLSTLWRMTEKKGLGLPLSLNQQRTWRDWSPPLKYITSAWFRYSKFWQPSTVQKLVASLQLSICTETCLGTIPRSLKNCPVATSQPSPQQYSQQPHWVSSQAEVSTATRGQSVVSQFWLQFLRVGLPVYSANFAYAGLLSATRIPPNRNTFTERLQEMSRAVIRTARSFIINSFITQKDLRVGNGSRVMEWGGSEIGEGWESGEVWIKEGERRSAGKDWVGVDLKFYMRITHYNIYNLKMSFMGGPSLDDYKNDVKPDQTMPNYLDSISAISWAPPHVGNLFATTSWDGQLRILAVDQGQFGAAIFQKNSTKFASPALKCAWNDQGNQIYVGLMDGSIKLYDLGSGQNIEVGRHGSAISSLHFVTGMNAIVSTAYEPQAQIWQQGNPNPVMSVNAQNKIFTSDFQFPTLVAGTANEKILLIDINNQNSRTLIDSGDLGKFSQIQSIAINHKCSNFGIASFDGRANISGIAKNVNGIFTPKSIITFKSNKQEEGGNTILYPINSVSFNPINDRWFMTAGADGGLHFWDYQAKNKIKTLNYGGNPICAAKVSPKGDMIAYGLGNDWHLGQEGVNKWPVKLGVHPIAENQTRFAK